jgi:integrase
VDTAAPVALRAIGWLEPLESLQNGLDERSTMLYDVSQSRWEDAMGTQITFKQAAHDFISNLDQPRRRGPLSENTKRLYRAYALRAARSLADTDMGQVRNGRVKAYMEELRHEQLAPSTIAGHFTVLQLVVATPKTADGEALYSPNFDLEFINAPLVRATPQPCATREDVERGDVLVKLLASTGLRVGEVEDMIYDIERAVIHIEKGKTPSATRDVHLTQEFNAWFKINHANLPRYSRTTYDRLESLGLPSPHAFRRFRITHLRKSGMNESVLRRQVGHADKDITSRYDRSGTDDAFVRAEVEKAGLGFTLTTSEAL